MKAQETANDPAQRYAWKLRLKSLYRRGYEKQDILELFRFIDWLLELLEGLEEQLWNELESYEQGEEAMPYVTSAERIGMKKGMLIGREEGREEGRQKEAAQQLRRQLTRRFGPLLDWAEVKLREASTDTLELWADRILDGESLEPYSWNERKGAIVVAVTIHGPRRCWTMRTDPAGTLNVGLQDLVTHLLVGWRYRMINLVSTLPISWREIACA